MVKKGKWEIFCDKLHVFAKGCKGHWKIFSDE